MIAGLVIAAFLVVGAFIIVAAGGPVAPTVPAQSPDIDAGIRAMDAMGRSHNR